MTTKLCKSCLTYLPLEAFNKGGRKDDPEYRRPRCKKCEPVKKGLCACGRVKTKSSYKCIACCDRDQPDPKQCHGCKRWFPLAEYSWRPSGHGGKKRRSRCKSCGCASAKQHRKNNPEQTREAKKRWNSANPERVLRTAKRAVWRRKGFDPDEIEKAIKKANNMCRICGLGKPDVKLCMDHCHTKNLFRGIICTKCNSGLGLFRDDKVTLINAIKYLEEFECKHKDV